MPCPDEMNNVGYLQYKGVEQKVLLEVNPKKPFVGYAFKLDENKFGQLTFVRVYQGKLKRGDYVYHVNTKKRVKVSRMVRMHANEMEDIQEIEVK